MPKERASATHQRREQDTRAQCLLVLVPPLLLLLPPPWPMVHECLRSWLQGKSSRRRKSGGATRAESPRQSARHGRERTMDGENRPFPPLHALIPLPLAPACAPAALPCLAVACVLCFSSARRLPQRAEAERQRLAAARAEDDSTGTREERVHRLVLDAGGGLAGALPLAKWSAVCPFLFVLFACRGQRGPQRLAQFKRGWGANHKRRGEGLCALERMLPVRWSGSGARADH
jgi:hypothetical protein